MISHKFSVRKMPFSELPDRVLQNISDRLNARDYVSLLRTCRFFHTRFNPLSRKLAFARSLIRLTHGPIYLIEKYDDAELAAYYLAHLDENEPTEIAIGPRDRLLRYFMRIDPDSPKVRQSILERDDLALYRLLKPLPDSDFPIAIRSNRRTFNIALHLLREGSPSSGPKRSRTETIIKPNGYNKFIELARNRDAMELILLMWNRIPDLVGGYYRQAQRNGMAVLTWNLTILQGLWIDGLPMAFRYAGKISQEVDYNPETVAFCIKTGLINISSSGFNNLLATPGVRIDRANLPEIIHLNALMTTRTEAEHLRGYYWSRSRISGIGYLRHVSLLFLCFIRELSIPFNVQGKSTMLKNTSLPAGDVDQGYISDAYQIYLAGSYDESIELTMLLKNSQSVRSPSNFMICIRKRCRLAESKGYIRRSCRFCGAIPQH